MYQRFIVFGALGLAAAIVIGGLAARRLAQPVAQTQAIPVSIPTPLPSVSATPDSAPAQPSQIPQATVPPVLPVATVKAGAAANLRSAPSMQSAIKSVVMAGQTVQIKSGAVVQSRVVWYPVIAGDQEGWIASTLLSRSALPTKEYKPSSQPPVKQSIAQTFNL